MNLFVIACALIGTGILVLAYQRAGRRRFETLVGLCGIALLAGGLAVARDATIGSTTILWVLSPATPVVATL